MSFQAYLDTIQARTGKSPADLRALGREKGFLTDAGVPPTVRATQITDWLKADFGLGHGHAMAIVALFRGKTD